MPLYSECCPPNPIQIGQQGPEGDIGPAGPTTTTQLVTVGGVTGLSICGVPVTRNPANGVLSWSPNGLAGIGCVPGGVGIIIDASSAIPLSVSSSGLAVGPVDAMSGLAITNFCQKVASCQSGGLTPTGAVLTAGPGLTAIATQLAIGDDPSSPVPYSVTAAGLNIGPVPAGQVAGLCAAVLACVTADRQGYSDLLVTPAAVCAAGAVTAAADTPSIDLTVAACTISASLRIDALSPLQITATANGVAVALPTAAQLCAAGVLLGVQNTPTVTMSVNGACQVSGTVNISNLISSGTNALTLGVDGRLLVSCAAVRPCFSATGPLAYNPTTGIFAISPGTNGQVLITAGSSVVWGALPPTTTLSAGCGVSISGGPAYTIAVNRAALLGAGLMAGVSPCQIALDAGSPSFTAGVCSYLGGLPQNGIATTSTQLVGADCRTYTLPAQVFPSLSSPQDTISISGTGTSNVTVDVNWADSTNVSNVQSIVCTHLGSRPSGGVAVPGGAGTQLVGANCQLFTIPTFTVAAACGITVTAGTVIGIDRAALLGAGLTTGATGCSIALDAASSTFRNGVCTYLGLLTNNGSATASTQLVGADCRTYTLPAAVAETANIAGCGILATGALARTIAVDRAALHGTTVATSLEAGADTCSIRVRVDGTTIGRDGTGAIRVNACSVLASGLGALATGPVVTGDRVLVIDSAGNCRNRTLGAAVSCEEVQDCVGPQLQATGLLVYVDGSNGFTAGGTTGAASAGGAIPVTNGDGTVTYVRPPVTTPVAQSDVVFGRNCTTGLGEYVRVIERMSYRAVAGNTILIPATDRVVGVDTAAGNATVTLTAPGACDPVDFHIKKLSPLNTLTITGGQIDGNAPGTFVIPAGSNIVGAATTTASYHLMHIGGGAWTVL